MTKFTAEDARTITDLTLEAKEQERVELLDSNNIREELQKISVQIRDACLAGLSEVTLELGDFISGGDLATKKARIKTKLQNLGFTVDKKTISW